MMTRLYIQILHIHVVHKTDSIYDCARLEWSQSTGSSLASICIRFPVQGVWLVEEMPLPHCKEMKTNSIFRNATLSQILYTYSSTLNQASCVQGSTLRSVQHIHVSLLKTASLLGPWFSTRERRDLPGDVLPSFL